MSSWIRKLFFFGSTGVAAALLYAGTVAVVVDLLGGDPLLGNLIGLMLAAATSYLGHYTLTFQAAADHRRYLPRFLAQVVIAYLVTSAATYAVRQLGLHYSVGVVLVLGILPAINLLIMNYWTFASPASDAAGPKSDRTA